MLEGIIDGAWRCESEKGSPNGCDLLEDGEYLVAWKYLNDAGVANGG